MVGFSFTPLSSNGEGADAVARLFAACEANDSDRVHVLLKQNGGPADLLAVSSRERFVDSRTADGATPLFVACKKGHLDCIVEILKASAQVNLATSGGLTPLWIAAQKGHAECIKLLLNIIDLQVDVPSSDGRTPLYAACEAGDLASVRLLMGAGASVETRRSDGSTPLIVSSYFGHAHIVEYLLAGGAKLTPADEDGTALQNARKMQRPTCVELLERAMEQKGIKEGEEDEALVADAEEEEADA